MRKLQKETETKEAIGFLSHCAWKILIWFMANYAKIMEIRVKSGTARISRLVNAISNDYGDNFSMHFF